MSSKQELLELKQLFVKATGEAFGASSGAKGKADSDKKKKKKEGGDGQPKHMDTRKADKAKKVGGYCITVFSACLKPPYSRNGNYLELVWKKLCRQKRG